MSTLGWRSLQERHFISRLGMFYQAHHHHTACTIPPYIPMTQPKTRTSHDLQYLPPQVYLDTYKFSFFPRCVKAWNILPSSIVSSSSVNAFKSTLQRSFTCGQIYMVPPRDFRQRPQLSSTSCAGAHVLIFLHTLGLYLIHSFTNVLKCMFLELLAFTPHKLVLCVAQPGNNAKTFVGPSCTDVDVDVDVGTKPLLEWMLTYLQLGHKEVISWVELE